MQGKMDPNRPPWEPKNVPLSFDEEKLGKVKPTLAESETYQLSTQQLESIFGIDQNYFGKLPKHMIVPVLNSFYHKYEWHSVVGHLYLVEPVAWVPQVHQTAMIPASSFKGEFENTTETITREVLNFGASAEISVTAGASYWGVTVEAKASSSIDWK